MAQTTTDVSSPLQIDKSKPIDLASDSLEVHQDQQVAIFIGNVIATQGTLKMNADKMTVHYRKNDTGPAKTGKPNPTPGTAASVAAPLPSIASGAPPTAASAPAPGAAGAGNNSIYRIESEGNVLFTNPTETAQGDLAIYDVDADSLDLTGNVIMTRDKNVLKGTKMHYNLSTGRSVLTGGAETTPAGVRSAGGRVHGLFWPGSGNNTTTDATPKKAER